MEKAPAKKPSLESKFGGLFCAFIGAASVGGAIYAFGTGMLALYRRRKRNTWDEFWEPRSFETRISWITGLPARVLTWVILALGLVAVVYGLRIFLRHRGETLTDEEITILVVAFAVGTTVLGIAFTS